MMQRRFGLGDTSAVVGAVGLGCWQLGGGDWGDISDDDALATLNAAYESGVTFFDTADVYGAGRSERLIGRFRQEYKPENLFIATKLGRFSPPGGTENLTPATMRAHTEASLTRLGVETLDITQLHCIPTEALQQGDVFQTLRELQAEGKIKQWGASVESVEEALLCLEQDGLASLQIIFNIFRQKPIDTFFDAAAAKGVALIVRLPLASGLLTGKLTTTTQFAPSDHRVYNRDGAAFNVGETFAGLPFERGVALSNQLKPLVPDGWTMTQMALRWCLDYPAVTVIIPGAKNPQQARENAQVADLAPLGDTVHQKLHDFYESDVAPYIRGSY